MKEKLTIHQLYDAFNRAINYFKDTQFKAIMKSNLTVIGGSEMVNYINERCKLLDIK